MLIGSQSPVTRRNIEQSRRRVVTIVKCAISSVLILWLLKDTSLYDIFKVLQSSYVPLMLLAFSLHFLGCFISVIRWRMLLRGQNIDVSLSFLLQSYMTAVFFNNLLPSTIGGDIIRIHDTYRVGKDKRGAVAAVLIDRLLGIFVLIGFVIFSIFSSEQFGVHFPSNKLLNVAAIFLVILFIIFVIHILNKSFHHYFYVKMNNTKIQKIIEFIKNYARLLAIYNKRTLYASILLSISLQINVVLYYFLISSGSDINISINEFFFIVPMIVFFMMLPISINGLGLRENIFVFTLSAYGVPKSTAIAVSWVDYGMVLTLGIIGGIIYMLRK